jgi:hypothetical protein
MESPQNRRFYFEVQSSSPLAHSYRWKEDNICACLGLPIGCMKFLFPRESITIFGLANNTLPIEFWRHSTILITILLGTSCDSY